jgi:hypothetical protein
MKRKQTTQDKREKKDHRSGGKITKSQQVTIKHKENISGFFPNI